MKAQIRSSLGAALIALALAGCAGSAPPQESASPTPAGPEAITDPASVDWENATLSGFGRCLYEGEVTFADGTASVQPTVPDEVFDDLEVDTMSIWLDPEAAQSLPLGPDGREYAAVPFNCLPEGGTSTWDSGYVAVGLEGDSLVTVGSIAAEAAQAGSRPLAGTNRIAAHSAVPPAGYRFQEFVQQEGDSNALPTGRAWSVWGWDEGEQSVAQLVRSESMADTVVDLDNAVILESPGGRGAVSGTSAEDAEASFAVLEERLGAPESTASPELGPPLDSLGYTATRSTWGGLSAVLVTREESSEEMYFDQCLTWTVDPREGEIPPNVVVGAGLRLGVSLADAGYIEAVDETEDRGPQYVDLSDMYDSAMVRASEGGNSFLVETSGVEDGEVLSISDGTACIV